MEISKPFEKIPPTDTQLGQKYRDLVSEAVDLATVRERLANRTYKSVIEWGLELRKVFWGWISFHQNDGHPVAQMALDIQEWFEKRFARYPRSCDEEWLFRLEDAMKLCQKLVDTSREMEAGVADVRRKSETEPKT